MNEINYSWEDQETNSLNDEITIDEATPNNKNELPTRQNLQIARRLFHMANGSIVATLYWVSFTHQQMIHALGTIACILYVVEQVRINYPELANRFIPMTRFIMRAEEQLKESAMVPYAFAVLLTIITFPKVIALIAIYTLAFADPLSAIIGIRFGKNRIVPHKSLEGSAAFFITTFIICLSVLASFGGGVGFGAVLISVCIALLSAIFEMLPLKLDDNLTIPLFTAFSMWIIFEAFSIQLI